MKNNLILSKDIDAKSTFGKKNVNQLLKKQLESGISEKDFEQEIRILNKKGYNVSVYSSGQKPGTPLYIEFENDILINSFKKLPFQFSSTRVGPGKLRIYKTSPFFTKMENLKFYKKASEELFQWLTSLSPALYISFEIFSLSAIKPENLEFLLNIKFKIYNGELCEDNKAGLDNKFSDVVVYKCGIYVSPEAIDKFKKRLEKISKANMLGIRFHNILPD